MKERIQCTIKNGVTHVITEKGYKLQISDESKSRINYVKEMLQDRTELSFMVYFNHICLADPLFAGYIAALIDPRSTRKLIAPVSYSHTERRIKNIGTIGMKCVADISGVETFRIIQSYQTKGDHPMYLENKASCANRLFFKRLKELNTNKTVVGCMICPEGHRSKNGVLGKGEEGVVLINKLIQPVINIPLGISFENGYNRKSLNFGKELVLNVGEINVVEAKEKRVSFENLMTDLAETLPIIMRGEWGEKII